MKLLETYANNTSVEIKHKPVFLEKFFPLGNIKKYITLQNSSGMPAKNYSWYQEIIDLIFPILEKNNIKILLLGDKDAQSLNKVVDLRGQTSLHQSAFLAKRALLHFGNDSWLCHYCAAQEIPLVALYGSTTVANHAPYHFNPEKTIFLESHRNGNKASFQKEENPKTVDLIFPEQITESVLKLLNIEYKSEYKTLEIGNCYSQRIVECVPDQVVSLDNLGVPNLVVRMDYLFDEPNLFNQLRNCKCVVITDRPINPELLNSVRPNIVEVFYHIKESPTPDPNFYKTLFNLKIPFKMFSFMSEEKINPLKLDALDFGIIHKKSGILPKNLDTNNLSKYYVKSNKFLLSNKQVFQSYYHYKNNLPIPKIEPTPQQLVKENLELLSIDGEYNYFLEKI